MKAVYSAAHPSTATALTWAYTSLPGASASAGSATSMRNRLPCTVQGLMSDSASDPLVRVALSLAGGGELLADITRASAQKLALAAGQRVLALCKAAAVRIVPAPPAAGAPDGCTALVGVVQHIACGVRRDEVLLRLGGGALLAGFAARGHALRCGDSACALVDASTVAVALA